MQHFPATLHNLFVLVSSAYCYGNCPLVHILHTEGLNVMETRCWTEDAHAKAQTFQMNTSSLVYQEYTGGRN